MAIKKALQQQASQGRKKRKTYTDYSDEQRANIGRYAGQNGNAAAVQRFRQTIPDVGESTVHAFKHKYLDAVKKCNADEEVTSLLLQKCGKPLAQGILDAEVQKYVHTLRKAGTAINTAVILTAAQGIVLLQDRTLLAENRGSIRLTKSWAASLMHRMGLVKRRGMTKKFKLSSTLFVRDILPHWHSSPMIIMFLCN